MAKIAFLLLAHKSIDLVIDQAEALSARGDTVTIHFDRNSGDKSFRALRQALAGNPNVAFAPRVKCGWGMWSLVAATLNMIRTARATFEGITHYYLMSGDCYPTKSRAWIERFLVENAERDFIERHDFFESDWIRTGLKVERLIYRHFFNERKHRALFYKSLEMQEKMGWKRALPQGLPIQIGSQWWLLRASTVESLLEACAKRPEIVRFFRTTWVPDEIFFQTLVPALVPRHEIIAEPPTHLIFSNYGMPVVFYQDHLTYLKAQPRLFARKISAEAPEMRKALLTEFTDGADTGLAEGPGRSLYDFLTSRGREGRRYAPRFWQTAIDPVEKGRLLIVVAKLWHVGKQSEEAIGRIVDIPRLGYLFDEEGSLDLPMGNLERGLLKRTRHRRAVVNLIMDTLGAERFGDERTLLCLDPGRRDVIEDLIVAAEHVKLLLIDRPVSEAHLQDHAERTGLVTAQPSGTSWEELRRTLRFEFETETRELHRRYRDRLFVNALTADREDNVLQLGHFLECRRAEAEAIARELERYVQ